MKKILINELHGKEILEHLINESINGYSDQVKLVCDYLNKRYIKADSSVIDKNGDASSVDFVIPLDKYNKPMQHNISLESLFEKLQEKFKHLFSDTKERDRFLKQLVYDWYYNKISKNYNLTNY